MDPSTWGFDGPAVRLGIGSVRGIGEDLAAEIAANRPYVDVADLARRVRLDRPRLEALATAGALACFGDDAGPLDRRRALWVAGAAAQVRPDRLPHTALGLEAPTLPGMDERETAVADLWATGISPDGHPVRFLREELDRRGVTSAVELGSLPDRTVVRVAGVVTHRQRPATAAGITFLNLEDETGLVNVVVSVGCWARHRTVVRAAPALVVRGLLERTVDGVVNVVAHRIEELPVAASVASRDFR